MEENEKLIENSKIEGTLKAFFGFSNCSGEPRKVKFIEKKYAKKLLIL
jgi:hypothetical protein